MDKTRKNLTSFERAYNTLNSSQKKAVDTIEGPVMVIAGPGTGKTTILTLRIANILRLTDTSSDSILALTFTESGAHTMRRKLLEIIGSSAYKVSIHTFHGFASQIIENHSDYFARIIGSKLITETEQIKILERIITSSEIEKLRPFGDPAYYINPILREIHILKRENISPDDLSSSIDIEDKDITDLSVTNNERRKKRIVKNRELAFVYKKYEEALTKGRYFDFDDMLLELIRAMEENNEFKLILQEKYQYILADEHQDANSAQNRILELLSDFHQTPNLFIVGDDKQAIYRFQGASLENFLYFSKKYPKAVVIDLEHNYRSHQGILDASHSLIINNQTTYGRKYVKLKSLIVGSRPIRTLEFSTVDDELYGIAKSVADLIARGEDPNEIAVLYRDNKHAIPLAVLLKAEGIVHRVESDHNVMDDIDIVKIIILCKAINDLSDSQLLAKALLIKELEADPAEVTEICKQSNRDGEPLHRVIKKNKSLHDKTVIQAYNKLVVWSKEAVVLPFPIFLQKIIQETNLLKEVISSPDSLERLNSVQTFFDYVTTSAQSVDVFRLADFVEYLNISQDHGISTRRSYNEHIKGVRLMTAHRAKGQEFDHVFIIHTVDGIWGNRSSRNIFDIPVIEHARSTGRIDDERRLFYVALTRARKTVTISRARGDSSKDTIPSQFISEIDQVFLLTEKLEANDSRITMGRLLLPSKDPVSDTSISILQEGFVSSKFIGQPLSVTHLNNYLECAWRYFFVNLIRIPQVENKHQLYGTAVHASLRSFFEAYKNQDDMNVRKLIKLFKHNIEILPFSVDDEDDSLKKGKKALEGYYKAYYPSWNRNLLTEYVIRGVMIDVDKDTKIELSGKLDKIELINDRDVVVVDYKTGKPKSRNQIEGKVGNNTGDGNYFRQLAFYKILIDADGRFEMKSGEIDFIEPNERGKYKKENFEIADRDLRKVKEEIVAMVKDITSLSFVNSKCDDRRCEYCKLGKLLVTK